MKQLENAVRDGACLLHLKANDVPSVFEHAVSQLVSIGKIPPEHRDKVLEALTQRERNMSTAIGHAVAIPHAYLNELESPCVAFVQLERPLNLGAPDGIPTHFLIFLLGPTGAAEAHLDSLTAIARLMSDDEFRYEAGEADTQQELLEALEHFRERMAPSIEKLQEQQVPDAMQFSGRPFGGLIADVKRRLPHYVSDFRDGLHPKSIAAVLFLVFAFLAPAITFGGILERMTEGAIGPVEMIAATAFCGCMFAIFGGQPLNILGGTGPLMIFTSILYALCKDQQIDFMPAYAWVGIWIAGILIALAAADACVLMRYLTRFTDEIFAALISGIFIYEAVRALARMFQGLEEQSHHATALFTLLLALGTFYIAMTLSQFRRSRYLLPWMREFLADFGPTIAIVLMSLVAVWLHEVDLEVLAVSNPVGEKSSWMIDLWAAPMWVRFAAVGPALLAVMLIFVNQNITARLVNSPEHHLQKGDAYHLDLAIVGGLIGVCSLFGLPWLIATIVPSINHVRSLATTEEVVVPGGDKRDRIIHVRETRVAALIIHLLIGLLLFFLPYLKYVPMAVLYGVLLFMGIVSIMGNQLFERLSLWLMDSKLYPTTHYIRRVPLSTIHKFTLLQLACLISLWLIKESPIGILFPLFIVLLVPVRFLANRFFAPRDLAILDASEVPRDDEWA